MNRTVYSLIGTDIHSNNGLCVSMSLSIYKAYVLPRVLYGLDTIVLPQYLIDKLESSHRKYLRAFQSLPDYVCSAIIYLLIGTLPLEGEIHLRKLALLGSIIRSENETMTGLCTRQLSVKKYKSNSWFIEMEKLLIQYGLPNLNYMLKTNLSKSRYKAMTHKAVHRFWTNQLRATCLEKSTTSFCDTPKLSTRKGHILWQIGSKSLRSTKRAITKARIVTGTFLLQSNFAKFSEKTKTRVSDTCTLCTGEPEDMYHFLYRCSALDSVRQSFLPKYMDNLVHTFGQHTINRITRSKDLGIQLVTDIGKLATLKILPLPNWC